MRKGIAILGRTYAQALLYRCLFLLSPFLTGPCLVNGQDWDVYLSGTISDAANGAPIPFAEVEVVDQLDTALLGGSISTANGAFLVELYSGAMIEGGYYLLEFKAPEHRSRMAVIDVSGADRELELNTAWRIHMDVSLTPASDTTSKEPLLGFCTFDKSGRNLRWATAETRKAYPIERYLDPRIGASLGLVDSVYRQEGTMVDGRVYDHWTGAGLEGATVRMNSDQGFSTELITDENGYYATNLPYDHVIDIAYTHPDKVSKRVQLDLRNIPEADRVSGFRAVVDMRLFAPLPGEDLSFLAEPIGISRYDPATRNMAWDLSVSKPLLTRQEEILRRHTPIPSKGRKQH